jgi:GT2 family glycosyltransferase
LSAVQKRRGAAAREKPLRLTWLGEDLLLVSGLEATAEWTVAARSGRKTTPVESGGVVFSKPEAPDFGIVLMRLPGHRRSSPPDSLVLTADGTEKKIGRAAIVKAEISLDQLIAEDLTGGDSRSRVELQDLLCRIALPALEDPGGLSLATRLRRIRDTLQPSLPELVSGPESPQAASVDLIMAVDERSFWVVGWVRDVDRTLQNLALVTPEGLRAEVLAKAHRHPRPDVREVYGDPPEERHGFAAYIRLQQPSMLEAGWLVLLARADGTVSQLMGPDVVRDPTTVRIRILDEFAKEWPAREQLRTDHALPALTRLQDRQAASVRIDDITQYGDAPEAPAVSIIIPIYGRIDLLEHQLAHFGPDPQLAEADIVFVLDSPELAPVLRPLAANLQALHGIPFRIVEPSRNAGYSGANNIGVRQARADLVLLLNSDVIPVRAGWLGQMAAFYESTPEIGALGPKLLFEDLSIQHAGMYFKRELQTSLWGNLHYYKGFHRDFAPACVSRPVPAVTGACMMVGRALYEEVGGLRYGYVQGGYEDSDFCVRLAERGLRNWYLAAVELYHLEAQSFPSPERRLATAFNTWLQTHLWNWTIERMMGEQENEQRAADSASGGERTLPNPLSSVA